MRLRHGGQDFSCHRELRGLTHYPPVAAFTKRPVSIPAKRQAVVNSSNTIFAFKRLIGRQFSDKEVKDDMKHWYEDILFF